MEYMRETIDPETGEITVVSQGDWITVTEFGKTIGQGPRKIRATLLEVGLLQSEMEIRMVPSIIVPEFLKPIYRSTPRLTPKAVRSGLGLRRCAAETGQEFDVLSPEGVEWIRQTMSKKQSFANKQPKSKVRDIVSSLLRIDPKLTQAEICRVAGLSRQLVSYHCSRLALTF